MKASKIRSLRDIEKISFIDNKLSFNLLNYSSNLKIHSPIEIYFKANLNFD